MKERAIKFESRRQVETLLRNYTIKDIAVLYRCTLTTIYRAMQKFNIPPPTGERYTRGQKKGKEHWNWQGGRVVNAYDYILLYMPDHPSAQASGYVPEHVYVWEQVHGQNLPEGWVIHHLNGIPGDNRPANLQALTNKKHAQVLAAKAQRIRELEAEVRLLQRALENQQLIFGVGEN